MKNWNCITINQENLIHTVMFIFHQQISCGRNSRKTDWGFQILYTANMVVTPLKLNE